MYPASIARRTDVLVRGARTGPLTPSLRAPQLRYPSKLPKQKSCSK